MRRKIYEQLLQWKEHEQDHVHFKNGSALNKDGTWKHGQGKLTNEQIQYLKQNGWNIE